MASTRGSSKMNLRSTTNLVQGERNGKKFQRVLRKKITPSSTTNNDQINDQRSNSPSTESRKRSNQLTPPTARKKIRLENDQRKSIISKNRNVSDDDDDDEDEDEDDKSEKTNNNDANSRNGKNINFVLAKHADTGNIKFNIDGYLFRRDGVSANKTIGLRCIDNTNRIIRCRMRGRAFPRGYCGSKKIPKLPPGDDRLYVILSSNIGHNHPPHTTKIRKKETTKKNTPVQKLKTDDTTKKKPAKPRFRRYKSSSESSEDEEEKEVEEEKKEEKEEEKEEEEEEEEKEEEEDDDEDDSASEEIGVTNRTKIKKENKSPNESRGRRSTKEQASMAWEWLKPKSDRQFLLEIKEKAKLEKLEKKKKALENLKRPPMTAPTDGSKLTLLQRLRKNAYQRMHYQKTRRPQSLPVTTSPRTAVEPRKNIESKQDEQVDSDQISTSSPALNDSSADESTFTYKVKIYDNKYYIMDGYAYLKERDRKGSGLFLHCVDRLNCKARAVVIWKLDEDRKTKCLYGRPSKKTPHSHDRSAPGHGVEIDEANMNRMESVVATTSILDPNTLIRKPLTSRGIIRKNESDIGASTSVNEEKRRRNSLLPNAINVQDMAANYRHCLCTLVDLQDGVNVQKYPALVRLIEATGEQLIEYLMDEDLNGTGGESDVVEDFGIDQKTIGLLNQQFKQYRALHDLFALSLEEFRKFIDAYERWLTPQMAALWWNCDMVEFIARRILRSEKYRDAYASALIRSQGSSRLRIIDRPVLPLPEPRFLRSRSNSVHSFEMRESLRGVKAMMDTLRGNLEGDKSTVALLLKEFDEAADNFLRFFGQNESHSFGVSGITTIPRPQMKRSIGAPLLQNKKPTTFPGMVKMPSSVPVNVKSSKIPKVINKDQLKSKTIMKKDVKIYEMKPTKNILRGIYFKYNYCFNRLCKFQKDGDCKISAEQVVEEQIDNEKASNSDIKCRSYWRSLKEYRGICDFLTLVPAHAVELVKSFQKWRVPLTKMELWKSGYVFEYICRRLLRTNRYKTRYMNAVKDITTTANASTLRQLPILPFGLPKFLLGGKSIQHTRMRSLALSRRIAQMKHTDYAGRIKVEEMLRDIETAANTFFEYLRSNDSWPVAKTIPFYLASENNNSNLDKVEEGDDLFERVHQELTVLDSLCVKNMEAISVAKINPLKPRELRAFERSGGKFVKTRGGARKKFASQLTDRPISPSCLLKNMKEKLDNITATIKELDALEAFSLQPLSETKIGDPEKSNPSSTSAFPSNDSQKLTAEERYVERVLRDLSHLEVVLTLDELGRAVEHCQFEHGSLGLIYVRNGRVVRCGNLKNDGNSKPNFSKRRVTLGVGELAKCVPLSKIYFDEEKRKLILNGVPLELRPAK